MALEDPGFPSEFDGYRLVRLIGAGGMGRVFLGHDTLLDRPVAIKFISTPHPSPDARARFLSEARAIARLQHPCVVAVYRVGEHEGKPYLVSELVEGRSLDKLALPLPWMKVLRIGYDLARGLAVAHRAGIVHRDIKPANAILAADGTVKLLDFGIARLMDPDLPSNCPVPSSSPAREHPERRDSPVGPSGRHPLADQAVGDGRDAADRADGRDAAATVAVRLPPKLADDGGRQVLDVLGFDNKITAPGKLVGTPLYMAPEVWRGEGATFSSDVYSLGALLFLLCTGKPPHEPTSFEDLREKVTSTDAPPLASEINGVDPAFAGVVDRCLTRDPTRRFRVANDVRAALAPLMAPTRASVLPAGNPYRGLRPFEADHQALFFARDSETRAVLDRMRTDPVVIVTGDSGVGKSSLLRAGVLPRVQDWLGGDLAWSVATAVPGRNPIAAICASLAGTLNVSEDDLATALAERASLFGRELARGLGPGRGVVLFIDQLEELVTLSAPSEAEAVAALLSWTRDPAPGIRVVATVRGDFLGRLATVAGIGDALPSALYFLRPLSPERIREAIVRPAEAVGLSFESDGLVDALVGSTAGAGGGLPLLQFALARLWEQRDPATSVIPTGALDAMGGVAGTLSLHADEVLAGLKPAQRAKVRGIMLRLVTPSGTRAKQTREELAGADTDVQETLDALVRGRLVVALESPDGSAYEVAHEALLSGWTTLARWLAADADSRVVRDRIATACSEWERLGRSADALWSLRQFEEAASVPESTLSPSQAAFLDASHRHAKRRRLVRRAALAGIVLALAAVYGGAKLKSIHDRNAQVDARLSAGAALLAEARELQAKAGPLETASLRLFDTMEREKAEVAWDVAREAFDRYREAIAKAGRELETAVALAPEREDVRSAFASALYLRALEADRRNAKAERDDIVERMALYDATGELSARWNLPALLSIDSSPTGTTAVLEQYVENAAGKLTTVPVIVPDARGHQLTRRVETLDAQGRPVAQSVDAPFSLPVTGLSVPAGSYRLRIARETGPETVHTFTVERGQELRLRVPIPPAGTVPDGFVYVPPGRFLFGSAQEDPQRRGFLHAVPIHRRDAGDFFIAASETTFAEYIQFLKTLPATERAARLPSVHAGGFEGALELAEAPDGAFMLTLKPSSTRLTARSGQAIEFPGRTLRKTQDWLKFPVVGIAAADAAAYAAWLAATGKVPRARLCTDLEWEYAARGADGREYPHGNVISPEDANFDETYRKDPQAMGPDEVGSHPASRSPYGLDDMSGNVWEWVASSVDPGGHAARGGSYYFDVNCARTANREAPEPSFRDASVGFRVCADPLVRASRF